MDNSRVKKLKVWKEFEVAFDCLELKHKKKYILLVIIGTLTGLFDFFGVLIFGVICTLAVRGIQNINPSPRINNLLNVFGLEDKNFKIVIAVLAFLGALFLIIKSLLSIYVTRRQNYFLNNLSANISNAISKMIFSNNLVKLKSTSTQDIRFLVLNGSKALTMGILANTATVVADKIGRAHV